MSCYEWESGHFKLSCKEYSRFKKEFRAQWNKSLTDAHEQAVAIHAGLIKQYKGKRNVAWSSAVQTYSVPGGYSSFLGLPGRGYGLLSKEVIECFTAALGDDAGIRYQALLMALDDLFPLHKGFVAGVRWRNMTHRWGNE